MKNTVRQAPLNLFHEGHVRARTPYQKLPWGKPRLVGLGRGNVADPDKQYNPYETNSTVGTMVLEFAES